MKLYNYFRSVVLIIFFSFLFNNQIYSKTLIFSEDFEEETTNTFPSNWIIARNMQWNHTSTACKNGVSDAQWKIREASGNKKVGILIDGPGCITEIVPTSYLIPNTSYYEFSVDMKLVGSVAKDRSINYRWLDGGKNYNFTVKDIHSINFHKAFDADYSYQFGSTTYDDGFIANNTYNFKIVVENNVINLYINDELITSKTDLDPILSNGTIALEASIGTLGPVDVEFDNVMLYDTTPQTPPAAFPYFSQTDPEWSNEKYDFINSTIGEVGCALSSVAMVFKSHGLDKIPLGNQLIDLNPKTLNNWLNEKSNHSRWGRGGIINWQAMTTLARDLNASDSAKYTKLEYQNLYPTSQTNIDQINDYLNQGNPLIFKAYQPGSSSGLHFRVASEVSTNLNTSTYTLQDPYDNTQKTLTSPPETYLRAGIYTPTMSNLSYLLIDADSDLEVNLFDPSGSSLNQFLESELPLANALNPLAAPSSSPYQQYSIKYPETGEYHLTLKSNSGGDKTINIQLFDKFGNDQLITLYPKLYPNQIIRYTIAVNQLNSTELSLIQDVSLSSLKQLIQHVYDAGEIKKIKIKDQLLFMVDKLEFLYSKNDRAALMNFHNFENHLNKEFQKNLIINPGYQVILNEIERLKAILF